MIINLPVKMDFFCTQFKNNIARQIHTVQKNVCIHKFIMDFFYTTFEYSRAKCLYS